MGKNAYLVISGCIFGLVAVGHLVRAAWQMPVLVGDWPFPMWASYGGLVVAGALCVWALRLVGK